MAAGALLSIVIAGIAAYHRTPWSDEGWFSSAAYNLAHHGFMGTTVVDPESSGLTRINQRTYWIMPLFPVGQAAWYLLFPSSAFWTRAYTICWVPLLLWAFYRFLRPLFPDSEIPPVATILLSCSFILIDNAGFARPDVQCCALGLSGLAFYIVDRERNRRRAVFVANAFVAASILTHPNGVLHVVGLWALILYLDGMRMRFRDYANGVLPYLIFASLWGIYISRDFLAFREQMTVNGTNGRWPSSFNPVSLVSREIQERYMVAFGFVTGGLARFKAIALAFYAAGVLGVICTKALRVQRSVRLLLILWAAYGIGLMIFNQKLNYYLIHIVPFYIALLAVWGDYLWRMRPRLRGAIVVGAAVLAGADLSGILVKSIQRSYVSEQKAAVEAALQRLPKSGLLNASASLIYAVQFDPRLLDDPMFGLRNGRSPQVIVVEELYRYQFAGWAHDHPDIYRQVMDRLARYKLVYHTPGYEVYVEGR